MTIQGVLKSVADQINHGALGPNVSAWTGGIDDKPAEPNGNGAKADSPAGSLPDKLLEKFRQYRGVSDDAYWSIGDAIDEAVVESVGRLTQNAVYGIAVKEMDISRGEVRVLHETARTTDSKLREEFELVLTHQHYRVLRYIEDRAKKHGYLKWCLESADAFGGRPAPASVLAKKVQKEMGIEPPPPTVGEILERAIGLIDKAYDLDPAAVWRELARYADGAAGDSAAGQAVDRLRFAASELKEASRDWGKAVK